MCDDDGDRLTSAQMVLVGLTYVRAREEMRPDVTASLVASFGALQLLEAVAETASTIAEATVGAAAVAHLESNFAGVVRAEQGDQR